MPSTFPTRIQTGEVEKHYHCPRLFDLVEKADGIRILQKFWSEKQMTWTIV